MTRRRQQTAQAQRAIEQLAAMRNAALEQMPERLREILNDIRTALEAGRDNTLNQYWNLGSSLNEIREHPLLYGQNGMALVLRYFFVQRRTLRRAAQFAREYSVEEFAQLRNLVRDDNGFSLHWGHVGYLLLLPSRAARNEFSERALAEMWTPAELGGAIRQRYGGARGSGGRPNRVPPTLAKQLFQFKEETRKWVSKYNNVWFGPQNDMSENLESLPADGVDDEIAENLGTVSDLLETMAEAVQSALHRMELMAVRVEELRREQAAATATIPPAGRHARAIDLSGSD